MEVNTANTVCVRCAWVCTGVWMGAGMLGSVLDEFSEYLLETRVLISADFNSYPIEIFLK